MRFARERLVPGDRLPAVTLHDALWWSLAATIAVLAAILLWMVVTPVSPLGDWKPAGARVMSPAARSALFASVDPFNRNGQQAPAEATAGPGAVTSLALTLFGVRINAATGGGSAIIAGADGVQQVYRVGAEVMPGVTLGGVHFDHVELARGGAKELLYLDQSKPAPVAAAPAPGAPAPATPAQPLTADAARANISFAPRTENGRVTGLQVSAGANAAPFRAAGFQPGDVVTSVAGKPVSGAADAAALAAKLQPGQSISVTINRNGQQLPLAISLPQ